MLWLQARINVAVVDGGGGGGGRGGRGGGGRVHAGHWVGVRSNLASTGPARPGNIALHLRNLYNVW